MCYSHFLTKLLTLGILFSTVVRVVLVVAKLVILGILFLTSLILALKKALVTNLVILVLLILVILVILIYFSIESSINS